VAKEKTAPASPQGEGFVSPLVAVGSALAVVAVATVLHGFAGWAGDGSQLALLFIVNLVLTSAAVIHLHGRWRTLRQTEARWLSVALIPVLLYFVLAAAISGDLLPVHAAAAMLRTGWIASQLIAAVIATAGLAVHSSRRLLWAATAVAIAGSVTVVITGLHTVGLAIGLQASAAGLAAAFLFAATITVERPWWRWFETGVLAALLLLAGANAHAALSHGPGDLGFLWSQALCAAALAAILVSSVLDQTSRLRALETVSDRVRRQRHWTQILMDALPVLVISVDADGSLRYANRAASRLLRVPRGVSDRNRDDAWLARLQRVDRERLAAAIPRVAAGSPEWEAVLQAVDSDGSIHWLNTQLHAISDPDSGERLVEVVASDVTDLFLARRTAEARQSRMAFLSNVGQTVAGEVEDTRILQRFLELGQEIYPSISLLLYRPLADGSRLRLEAGAGPGADAFQEHHDHPVGVGHPCTLTFRDGVPRSARMAETLPEKTARRLTEEQGITHLLYLPLLAAGRVIGVLATTTPSEPSLVGEEVDLLTQVGFLLGGAVYLSQLVRELEEQRAVAMEASRLKSEFLANTSHELRTPLTAILGFLRLVIDGAVEEPEKQREFLKIAHESAEKLLTIINDVLDLAKIEAGRLEVQSAPVPVHDVLSDVESLFQHQMRSQGVTFTVEAPDLRLVVWADPDRTVQILTNLLSNALKFTPRGGRVTVACAAVGDEVQFTVADTGNGIADDELSKVFESFYQVDGSTTRTHGGTGLGLTISRRLAHMMGGTLMLESAGRGQGTTARLSLREFGSVQDTVDSA